MPQDTVDDRGLQSKAGSPELVEQFVHSAQGRDFKSLGTLFRNVEAIAALESADAVLKTIVLAQPCVVDRLAVSGAGPTVVRIIDTLDTDKQAEILRARYAISGLLFYGESAAVFRLLGGLNADQKTAALTEDGVIPDIARQRHGGKLIKLMRSLDWYRQATILGKCDAIWALRMYGQRESVNKMLAQIYATQEAWLSRPRVIH